MSLFPIRHRYDFFSWDLEETPAYWLATMSQFSDDGKYQIEIDRRLAELRRQDALEEKKEERAKNNEVSVS
jgi:hypothetical protein